MNKKISIILAAVLFAGAFAATAAELLLFSAAAIRAELMPISPLISPGSTGPS